MSWSVVSKQLSKWQGSSGPTAAEFLSCYQEMWALCRPANPVALTFFSAIPPTTMHTTTSPWPTLHEPWLHFPPYLSMPPSVPISLLPLFPSLCLMSAPPPLPYLSTHPPPFLRLPLHTSSQHDTGVIVLWVVKLWLTVGTQRSERETKKIHGEKSKCEKNQKEWT